MKLEKLYPVFLAVLMLTAPISSSLAGPPQYEEFQKGVSYACWWHDTYETTESDLALAKLADTGASWVALIVTWYQDTYQDTAIFAHPDSTPSDRSVIHAISVIHNLGLKVMLKPHVDLLEQQNTRYR